MWSSVSGRQHKMDLIKTYFGFSNKFLLANLVQKNLKVRYRRSALGYFWTILVPLATSLIYVFFFTVIFQIKSQNFTVQIVTCVLTWSLFSVSLSQGLASITSNKTILSRVNVPINIFALANTFSNFITLLLSLPVILTACWYFEVPLGLNSLWYFYFISALALISYPIGLLFGVALIYAKDIQQLLNPLLQLWLYITPILFTPSRVPEAYKWALYINPTGMIFSGIQTSLLNNQSPGSGEVFIPILWCLILNATCLTLVKNHSKLALESM